MELGFSTLEYDNFSSCSSWQLRCMRIRVSNLICSIGKRDSACQQAFSNLRGFKKELGQGSDLPRGG